MTQYGRPRAARAISTIARSPPTNSARASRIARTRFRTCTRASPSLHAPRRGRRGGEADDVDVYVCDVHIGQAQHVVAHPLTELLSDRGDRHGPDDRDRGFDRCGTAVDLRLHRCLVVGPGLTHTDAEHAAGSCAHALDL